MNKRNQSGVTLIELMIVVVVIGVLASIAYPSYRNYLVQSRRSDAQIALLRLAADQERFFSDCNRYANSLTAARDCGGGSFGLGRINDESPDGYYRLQVVLNSAATTFTATATPVSGKLQAQDATCTSFSINSAGVKSATGANPSVCWRK